MKILQDMSLKELWQLFPIILRPYNPCYSVWYEEQKTNLVSLLACNTIVRISHIGSTAVLGLKAKPIVDILLELPKSYDVKTVGSVLEANGWLVMASNDAQRALDLNKGYTPEGFAEKVFHLHIKPSGDWGELYFRDYLNSHPDVARKYEALKCALKCQFEHDRDAYTQGKTQFVKKYTALARKEFGHRYGAMGSDNV